MDVATIRQCEFEDWDFAAVNIGAPSKNVHVATCKFTSSEESDITYGVRPFAHIAGASTDAYDETNGTLLYSAPRSYHQNITVRDCSFYQCSHSILSWNVHGANYVNNEFRKPTIRTLSVTNWNFDVLIGGNKHLIENNSVETVSTAIAVGIGSQRIKINNEHFTQLVNGFVVTNTCATGWKVRARGNQFVGGKPTYVTDFGAGKTVFHGADSIVLSGSVTFAAATRVAVALGITLASSSYRVRLGPASHARNFRSSRKTATGFNIDASSTRSGIVDWTIDL